MGGSLGTGAPDASSGPAAQDGSGVSYSGIGCTSSGDDEDEEDGP